jgi:hypothetical protein
MLFKQMNTVSTHIHASHRTFTTLSERRRSEILTALAEAPRRDSLSSNRCNKQQIEQLHVDGM